MGAVLRDESAFRKIIPPKSLCLRRWSPEPSHQMTCGLKRFRVRKSAQAAPAAYSRSASIQSLGSLVPPPVSSPPVTLPPVTSLHFTLTQVASLHVGYSSASNSRQSIFASCFVSGDGVGSMPAGRT